MNLNFSLFVTECCTEVCLQNLEDNYKWDFFLYKLFISEKKLFYMFWTMKTDGSAVFNYSSFAKLTFYI